MTDIVVVTAERLKWELPQIRRNSAFIQIAINEKQPNYEAWFFSGKHYYLLREMHYKELHTMFPSFQKVDITLFTLKNDADKVLLHLMCQ